MNKTGKAVIGAALGLAAAGAFGAACLYRYVFWQSNEEKQAGTPLPTGRKYEKYWYRMWELMHGIDEIPFEEVEIRSFDGLPLYGRYYHVKDGAPLEIQFHGYHGSALRDFAGGHKIARESGRNVLLVDVRAHGKSGGHLITFGIRERRDVKAWADYAAERFGKDTPIFLVGASMGAASVIMAADLPLPDQVAGIMADSPYSSPEKIIRTVIAKQHGPEKLFWPMLYRMGKMTGFDLKESSAETAAAKTDLPILLIHGEEDRFVPAYMSEEIRAAAGEKARLELFPEAAHVTSFLTDEERYTEICRSFADRAVRAFEEKRQKAGGEDCAPAGGDA